ncbi:MAG TPA: cyclic nucleotide-binding domain-containing protein [Acidimicrobiales bacterium]|nr:cyclic nucleotide-binding domain-containing protein [Acidimicrobiales bacterium]
MTKRHGATKAAMLRTIPSLSRCSQRELATIGAAGDEIVLPAGRVLMAEGERGDEAFLIVEGSAEVKVAGETVAEVGPGDFVGEMALLERRPRTATVVATSPLRVLAIGARRFPGLLDLPGVAWAVSRALAERLRLADSVRVPVAV